MYAHHDLVLKILPRCSGCFEICKLPTLYCHNKTVASHSRSRRIIHKDTTKCFKCSQLKLKDPLARFADALLRELAGITIPAERIYGLGSGPKVKVLQQLQAMPQHEGLSLHFVEDRVATLKNVIKEPALDGWNLYLGRWGYNTEREREEAESIPRIQLLDLSDFSKKLK
ncbi:hypothetical protein ZIOFF_026086 [Zingiber officinale]|uniref:Uncharacterized protein n=1 Tax=Zingiber officinale TaxID=94328 RepID=A0A8J5LHP5_ZINOF|nr:hypothetical protein ZIOFF_026086 [Zingiber officinale]